MRKAWDFEDHIFNTNHQAAHPSTSHALPEQAHAPGFQRPRLAPGLEKMTEWALLTFQACHSLGLMFYSSHLQEQEPTEKSLGMQKTKVAPEIMRRC